MVQLRFNLGSTLKILNLFPLRFNERFRSKNLKHPNFIHLLLVSCVTLKNCGHPIRLDFFQFFLGFYFPSNFSVVLNLVEVSEWNKNLVIKLQNINAQHPCGKCIALVVKSTYQSNIRQLLITKVFSKERKYITSWYFKKLFD